MAIDTGAGLLLKPRAAFEATQLSDVAGMLEAKVNAKTDQQIVAALQQNAVDAAFSTRSLH